MGVHILAAVTFDVHVFAILKFAIFLVDLEYIKGLVRLSSVSFEGFLCSLFFLFKSSVINFLPPNFLSSNHTEYLCVILIWIHIHSLVTFGTPLVSCFIASIYVNIELVSTSTTCIHCYL